MADDLVSLDIEVEEKLKIVGALTSGVFSSLVEAAGLDPQRDFMNLNLAGVNFEGADIRGYNFTGADLSRSVWTSAIYDSSTILDSACLDDAVGLDRSRILSKRRVQINRSRPSLLRHRQTTLGGRATVSGIGIHSGRPASITFHPAEANTGIVFVRLDEQGRPEREIRAHARYVTATELATVLGDDDFGPCVSTIEHIMATLCGLGVDNALVEVDGPEAPIMDGSATAFVAAIDHAGVVSLSNPRRYFKVLKRITVERGDSFGELTPYERGFRVDVTIDFDHPLIGEQSIVLDVEPTTFRREVARARTFGFMRDVSKLWSAGYALGSSLENTLVVAEDRLLNPEGLRYADEFVRHRALDAIGDLALAGGPLLAAYKSIRGGHRLNHAMLTALVSDPTAWTVVEAKDERRPIREQKDARIPSISGKASISYS